MTRDDLLAIARQAALHAYAPYSRFRVGAALVVETPAGPRIVTGANVENASYGLTLCAERATLAAAVALYGNSQTATSNPAKPSWPKPAISQLAVACIDVQPTAPAAMRTPCGACRQWLAELAPQAVYYIDGIATDFTLQDLLPHAFLLDT